MFLTEIGEDQTTTHVPPGRPHHRKATVEGAYWSQRRRPGEAEGWWEHTCSDSHTDTHIHTQTQFKTVNSKQILCLRAVVRAADGHVGV